ncbi:MAG: TonB family protein [Bacteroidetes bacterium]|nr:TonB family protein [Bacteroidota bacterium]
MKKLLFTLCMLSMISVFSQQALDPGLDTPPQNVGGKTEFEHVFHTQMQYPDSLLKAKISEEVAVYFYVAADGKVSEISCKNVKYKAFETEAKRIMRFYKFEPGLKDGVKTASHAVVVFKFEADAYKKICKNRGFVVPAYSGAQSDTSYTVYERADSSPEYYKGEEALGEFVLKELEYPPLAVRQNIQGTVVMRFIVEPNGCVSNIEVLKGVNAGCSEEAIRVMRLTHWKPATKDGKLVRYHVTYPIVFNLNNVNKDNSMSGQGR